MTGESFEYAIKKDVRNNPIVREVDRERHREMWRSATVGVFLVAVLVFSVWRQVELVWHGYELDDLQAARAAEDKTNRQLRLESETLRSPAVIERRAIRELRMIAPGPADYGVIERVIPDAPPPHSVVARR
jgi:cell division protein FtsL